jgi:hypothetical protein
LKSFDLSTFRIEKSFFPYFVIAKKTYTEVGHVNKHIRDILINQYGLRKCKVKAVALSPQTEELTADGLESLPWTTRLKSKETGKPLNYIQQFKIGCADEEYSKVLDFLRTDEYKIRNNEIYF